MFHFTCFNVEDPNDPSVGLVNGQLSIPGILLRREVFDPVVVEVCCTVSSLIYHTGWLLAGITTHRGPNSQGRSKDWRSPARGRFCRKRISEATSGGNNLPFAENLTCVDDLSGTIFCANPSDRQACRCWYSDPPWRSPVWFGEEDPCIQRDCSTVLRHESIVEFAFCYLHEWQVL